MEPRNPQDPFIKTVAALVAVLAFGLLVVTQRVTATDTASAEAIPEQLWRAGYFPAQFTIKPAADERDEPIPTF